MGSAQGKATNDTLSATPTKQNVPDNISAIYAIASSLNNLSHDPRSPAYKRSPMASPFDSPCSTPPSVARARMLQRLGSASKFGALDPRSPASKRTPMREVVSNEGRTLPPPFSLGVSYGDPRSPSIVTRTPLAGSTQDDIVVVPDDIVVAEEVVCDIENDEAAARASTDSSVKGVEPMSLERETSEGADSMCGKVTVETFSSPEYTPSPAIMALTMSPLNSPISARKRKDLRKGPTLSPLKKSYSAPIDENFTPNPPSPSMKARTRAMQPRTPLSPITNSRHCMGVQPIKLRMDPAILG